MRKLEIDVAASGAVSLGGQVVCDGFRFGAPVRVQTHVHDDHMDDFETSKQFQDIYMSEGTRDLLVAEFNADIPYRTNVHALPFGRAVAISGGSLELLSSGHMLGAAQAVVETVEGIRLGYSGDFQWPLEQPIQVDALVVDATYGSPRRVREYTQADAAECLIGIVMRALRRGPVNLKGYRGTIQRALEVLSGEVNAPIIGSAKMCRYVDVFRKHGWGFESVTPVKAAECEGILAGNRYIRLYSKGDNIPDRDHGTVVTLSAYMNSPNSPFSEWADGNYTVAMSDHADFYGTLEYVRATNAKVVITDNTRNHGVELANELRYRLGIDARPSSNDTLLEWGA